MSDSMAFTAALDCGCIVAATVDKPEYKRDTAREVGKWIRDGLTVEHRRVDDVKADPLFLHNCGGAGHKRKVRR